LPDKRKKSPRALRPRGLAFSLKFTTIARELMVLGLRLFLKVSRPFNFHTPLHGKKSFHAIVVAEVPTPVPIARPALCPRKCRSVFQTFGKPSLPRLYQYCFTGSGPSIYKFLCYRLPSFLNKLCAFCHTVFAIFSAVTPLISAIFCRISGMLSGVLGNVPALDFGGRYGLSVSVKSLSSPSDAIALLAFLLPEYVLVPPKEKYAPIFSSSAASSAECE